MQDIPPDVLKAARELAGLSQGGLASVSGVTRRTVGRAEKGLSIHVRNTQKILDALARHRVTIEITNGEVVLRRSRDPLVAADPNPSASSPPLDRMAS